MICSGFIFIHSKYTLIPILISFLNHSLSKNVLFNLQIFEFSRKLSIITLWYNYIMLREHILYDLDSYIFLVYITLLLWFFSHILQNIAYLSKYFQKWIYILLLFSGRIYAYQLGQVGWHLLFSLHICCLFVL